MHDGWVCLVIVRFNVRIRQRLRETGNDWLNLEWRLMGQGVRQNVARGHFDGLFKEIVFEDDETGAARRHVLENVAPVLKDALDGCLAIVNVEI